MSVPAGKPSPVALHFRVAQGLHINSHTPSDEFLIPTNFRFQTGWACASLRPPTRPASSFRLPSIPRPNSASTPANSSIQARIVATPGNHLVQGKLHYQACDQNQCLPPKTIDVPIDVIGE